MKFDLLEQKPRLRWPLDIQQHEVEGQKFFVLRDLEEVAPEAVLIPAPLAPIIGRFDGQHSLRDIIDEGALFGVTEQLVVSLVRDLSSLFFLDTSEAAARWREIQEEFQHQPIREAAHLGRIYPASAEDLRETLLQYIAGANTRYAPQEPGRRIISLVAPHIDYHRGQKTYGAAYSVLQHIEPPDVIFLLGTAHQPSSGGSFHLTDKGFRTPFGIFPSDQAVISALCAAYGRERLFRDEFLHKREHSLELQLPFLAHRFSNGHLPTIVPILVGSFHHYLTANKQPVDVAEVGDFIGALASITKSLRESGKKVLFYSGIDLAHVGLHFGDTERVSDSQLGMIETRDKELLNHVLAADEQGLFAHMAEDLDRRRICGFPSLYTMLATMKQAGIQLTGHFVEYRQAVEPKSDCVVTFASACWVER